MVENTDELCATSGAGPLLERDYSATIVGSTWTPEQIGGMLRERFAEFAPLETAAFATPKGGGVVLEVGHELEIRIALVGCCRVRVIHCDERSLTLRTLSGHPEAGRISFGADRDEQGRLTFRICSRARASGMLQYLGFLLLGKQMQGRCWIRYIQRVTKACGGRIEGRIRVSTHRVHDEPTDQPGNAAPTFARGDLG